MFEVRIVYTREGLGIYAAEHAYDLLGGPDGLYAHVCDYGDFDVRVDMFKRLARDLVLPTVVGPDVKGRLGTFRPMVVLEEGEAYKGVVGHVEIDERVQDALEGVIQDVKEAVRTYVTPAVLVGLPSLPPRDLLGALLGYTDLEAVARTAIIPHPETVHAAVLHSLCHVTRALGELQRSKGVYVLDADGVRIER